jgi:hypothetical protein
MRRVPSFALLLLLLFAAPLGAQTVPSPFRYIETKRAIGPFGGMLLTDPGSLELGPKSAPILGIRGGLQLTGPLSAELTGAMSVGERDVYVPTAAGPGEPLQLVGTSRLTLVLVDATARFHLTGPRTWHGVAPFLLGSAGIVTDLARQPAIEELIPIEQRYEFGLAFAGGLGVGTDFFLRDRLSIRVEARDYLWRLTHPDGLTASGESEREWVHNFAFTLGGAYHF